FREYTNLKRQYPDTIIGFELNGYFEFYGEDARKVAEICGAALLEKNTPAGQTAATGFSVPRWPSELRRIWSKGNNVYLAGENADGTHSEIKHVYGRDYLPLHAVVHIDNRTYSIDQVDFQKDAVTLRDITGTTDTRFPPTRQETTGMVRSYLEDEPSFPIQETGENETLLLPMSIEAASEYNGLKARYPDAMIGFEQHGKYEFYGEDAELAGLILRTNILNKEIPGGHIQVTGFPVTQWQEHFKALWRDGNDVYLASEKPDGTHEEKKYYRKADYIPLNAQIHFGGREYRVASVDFEQRTVSLQDLTALRETNETRFRELLPIEVRNMLEDQTDPLLFVESDLKHAPELDAEPIASVSPENHTQEAKEQDVPAAPEDVPPLQPGERRIPAHDGIPALRQIVIDLTGRGQEPAPPIKQKSVETQTPSSYSLHPGDTVYLDERPFFVEDVRLTEVSFHDPAALYPISRVESKRSLERTLPLDDRNSQYRMDAERADAPIHDTVASAAVNFRITDDHLGEGGQKTKYANNVAAIRTLKKIESENRRTTPEEQDILSRYVGWGGIPQAFDPSNASWDSEFSELAGLLTDEEYELARASTLNAHYTSPTVIKAMYQALEQMGFRTGNILEPSCGIGNFFGLLPDSMQNSKLYGVELDSITGRIA
ncbi:MAG: hypothetical protein IJJ60_02995, partial [Clostridia bacterium]|nr:hypothetical protein [Clostridia bacterium]